MIVIGLIQDPWVDENSSQRLVSALGAVPGLIGLTLSGCMLDWMALRGNQ